MIGHIFSIVIIYLIYNGIRWKLCKPDFSGKVVFITGGSSGIGEELAKRFVELGAAKVVIAARRKDELLRVKASCKDPSRVEVIEMDLSKPEKVLEQAMGYEGKVDILVNNGGLSMREDFESMKFQTCQYMMNTNCMSHIALTQGLLPKMISQRSGHIVNIISISGLVGVPMRTMYSASKFAMDGFTKALRSEVKKYKIKTTCVYPAYIKTNMSKNAATGSGEAFGKVDENIEKGMPVDKAVSIITKAVHMGRAEVTVGSVFYQIIPSLMFVSSWLRDVANDIKYKSQLKVREKAK